MSDRQVLAERGTELCIAAIGLAGVTGALLPAAIPVAALIAVGVGRWQRSDRKKFRATVKAAEEKLTAANISDTGIKAAVQLLKERADLLKLDPSKFQTAEARADVPGALLSELQATGQVPPDDGVPEALRIVFDVSYQNLRTETEFHRAITQDQLNAIEGKLTDLGDKIDDYHAMVEVLVEQIKHDPKHKEEVERRGKLVIALAETYAEGNPDDFDSALNGLKRALEVAAEERAKGALPSNTSDAVDVVVRRIDDLNDAGRVTEGVAEIRRALAALADEVARQKAAQGRMLDKGIAQAVLARDVDLAVEMELGKLDLEGGRFEELCRVRNLWYERGRDQGLRFELEVAIALAESELDLAAGADELGTALDNLGKALATLGVRERSTDRLERAEHAFHAALEERARDRVPLDWAATQNNLGLLLSRLGQRESSTDRLEQAVDAYCAALEERTRDCVPLDWAETKNNLGLCLGILGQREIETDRLEQSVNAFCAALEVRTRNLMPLEWAITQNNLGNAFAILGEREGGRVRLEQAVIAYREVLEERTRDREPLNWAMTQSNLGSALSALGEQDSCTARLDEAASAYRAALKEWTRERVPLNWAMTQGNLCLLECAFFDKSPDVARLVQAQFYADAAREVYVEAKSDHYVDWVDGLIASINARRDEMNPEEPSED